MKVSNNMSLKILHINSYFSTSGLFKQLYDRQIEQGHDLSVYVPISHSYPQSKLAASGEYTQVVPCFDQWQRYFFHLKHQRIWQDLKNRYSFSAYDVIHAHSLFSNGWLAHQIYQEYGVPYIVAVRNADIHTFFNKLFWLRPMGLRILQDARQIIFISENSYHRVFDQFIPKDLLQEFDAKTQVITNGIEDFWHQEIYLDKIKEVHRPLRIVSTGKLMTLKRFVPLARMIHQSSQLLGPIELHIVGPAWDKTIEKQLSHYPFVTYHGPLNKEAMRDLYRQMDIFALLSYPETFGLVYPEAMSQGLPVIYTRGEGFDSFFPDHQVGASIQRDDAIGFHQGLEYILQHYDRLSQNALSASQIFQWDQVASRYQEVYNHILHS